MIDFKEEDMKKFAARADYGGIISLDTSKRLTKVAEEKKQRNVKSNIVNLFHDKDLDE